MSRLTPFALWTPLLAIVFLLYAADDHEALPQIVEYPAGQCRTYLLPTTSLTQAAPLGPNPALVPDELAPGVAFIRKFTSLGHPANATSSKRYAGIAHAALLRAKNDLLWAERLLAAHRATTPLPGPCRSHATAAVVGDYASLRKQPVFDVDLIREADISLFHGPPYVLAYSKEAARASMCRATLAEAQMLVDEKRNTYRVAQAAFLLY